MTKLKPEDVEWVVNDGAELGVKIGDQFFWLYKGLSIDYGVNDESPTMWRHVFKREFGECCHPWDAIKRKTGQETLPRRYVGFLGEDESEWKEIPK